MTQRGNNRAAVFVNDEDRAVYIALLAEKSRAVGLRVVAYCLMDNHIHLVVVPQSEASLPACMARTHQAYALRFNDNHGRSGHLWQARYHSCPLDRSHLDNALSYVEQNPVKAGLVDRPWDYPWSSARAHVGMDDGDPILDLGWWERHWDPVAWRRVLEEDMDQGVESLLRSHTTTGRPIGSEEFVRDLEVTLGRPLARRSPGRPRKQPA